MQKIDTHKLYKTINHDHIGWLIIIECENGLFFVETEFETNTLILEGLSYPFIFPYKEPKFFNNKGDAEIFAKECIKADPTLTY